ncbi:S-adenosyl-L-methionine-dependent methyltransferase [Podospora aff. communis PSN243]|uniref:tRNA (adenine(58)-N(1))-methyltransferase catalytic subunit TRM61 n=1 Tax=Podospora aff. communis PSN243 TaxID=3040156 RepID=A0AAV9GZG0_9PEZI|nr:S-adenosyl-L-methionine-dependent methyltransferase [Podospora aff. communis PSN243]
MAPTLKQEVSPFLDPGALTKTNSLAVIQLSRDNFVPVYLKQIHGEHDGYAEGAVLNTRFGSFPHTTLIGVPWGSQIRASKVDTGSRGRKRKRQGGDDAIEGAGSEANDKKIQKSDQANGDGMNGTKQPLADSSGFVHVLPPTPEIWTTSLPHRTQVVYTPDYSYVLYRLRAKPGSTIIEAGAGSGSFTHASVRAVYNGYPAEGKRTGKVVSFEYNEERYHKMQEELQEHGLKDLVHLTHRNVYKDGFLLNGKSPEADAVFLDLPAPWEALHHLSRKNPKKDDDASEWISPLHPKKSAHLCTFSPCIEQVTKTVSVMRRLGWIDIEMVEIANRRLHTLRDRVGLSLQIDRGVNNSPRDVEEALTRLTEIEDRFREQARQLKSAGEDVEMAEDDAVPQEEAVRNGKRKSEVPKPGPKFPWQDGRLITRGEPEIKTHTSYLVFATLPIEWSEEDEAAAAAKYPVGEQKHVIVGALDRKSRKEERREQLQNKAGTRKTRKKERDAKIAEAVTTAETTTEAATETPA